MSSGDLLTIPEFCRDEKISRQTYYNLKGIGRAPEEMQIGASKRITPEARQAWRERMQREPVKGGLRAQAASFQPAA